MGGKGSKPDPSKNLREPLKGVFRIGHGSAAESFNSCMAGWIEIFMLTTIVG